MKPASDRKHSIGEVAEAGPLGDLRPSGAPGDE